MAKLLMNTFNKNKKDEKMLLLKIRYALKNLCGHGSGRDGSYLTAPRKLNKERDFLKANYKEIWKMCTIRFNPTEPGASIKGKKDINIGPFFLSGKITITDMEKTILHEYLHAALDTSSDLGHHGLIYQILIENLKYPEPANVGTCGSF